MLALVLLSTALVELLAKEVDGAMSRHPQVWARVGGGAALLILGALGGSLAPVVLILVIAAVMITMVAIDVRGRLNNPAELKPEHTPTPGEGLVQGIVP